MDLDRAKMFFSQPTWSPVLGESLEEGLRQLIRRANTSIVICSCEFTKRSNFILNEEISNQLRRGRKVVVYGNHKHQMEEMKAAYGELGLDAFYWIKPEERSLFHIKAIIVDGNWAYIGSANLSNNAMQNNAEWGIITHSPELCLELREYIQKLSVSGRFSEV